MRVSLQTILDRCYDARKAVFDLITWVSIRICGLEVALRDVRRKRYEGGPHVKLNLGGAQDLDLLLTAAKDRLKEAADRRSGVSDKIKTLLTLTSALVALLALFWNKASQLDSVYLSVPLYCGVLFLLDSLVITWVYFDVRAETVMELSQDEVNLNTGALKISQIHQYSQCQTGTDAVTDYAVDLYQTARFFALLGFLIIFGVCSVAYFRTAGTESEKVARELRNDPKFLSMIQGPKGDKGERGPKGDPGLSGPPGPQGKQGPSSPLK